MKLSIKDICEAAIVASLYIILTILFPIKLFGIEFRISEAIVLLCFYNKKYIFPLVVACCISNFFLWGIIDVIVGGTASFLALTLMSKCKNIYIGSLMTVIFSTFIAVELTILMGFSFQLLVYNLFTCAISQFVTASVIGVILFKILEKNRFFMEMIGNERN